MDKFDIAYSALAAIPGDLERSVLDVGCRDCVFEKGLSEGWTYRGLDLYQNDVSSVDFVQSVEDGIPVPDRAFTSVVALDVVEHVDRISQVMDELWRVTDRRLVVALPNMAFVLYRLKFLWSGSIGEKYRILPYGQDAGDRHRWLTTARESVRFMKEFAAAKSPHAKLSYRVTEESALRRLFARAGRMLGLSEQLYASNLVFVIERVG